MEINSKPRTGCFGSKSNAVEIEIEAIKEKKDESKLKI
jgi:hypothetical protein